MNALALTGDAETALRLARARDSLFASAKLALTAQAAVLAARVRDKLDGEVLQPRSGRLRDSVAATIETNGDGVAVTLDAAGVPYATIQEYGGVVHIPDIVPDRAKALAFEIKGELVFAQRVRAHDVTIPERSYLRSSLAESRDAIQAALRDALDAAANEA